MLQLGVQKAPCNATVYPEMHEEQVETVAHVSQLATRHVKTHPLAVSL
jgi:hypothetical protein